MSSSVLARIMYKVFQQFFRTEIECKKFVSKKICKMAKYIYKLLIILNYPNLFRCHDLRKINQKKKIHRFSNERSLIPLHHRRQSITPKNPILLISIKYSFLRRESDERNHHVFLAIRMHRSSAEMGRNLLYTLRPGSFHFRWTTNGRTDLDVSAIW